MFLLGSTTEIQAKKCNSISSEKTAHFKSDGFCLERNMKVSHNKENYDVIRRAISQIEQFSMQTQKETLQNYCSCNTAQLGHPLGSARHSLVCCIWALLLYMPMFLCFFSSESFPGKFTAHILLLFHHRNMTMWPRWHHLTKQVLEHISSHLLTTSYNNILWILQVWGDERFVSREAYWGFLHTFFFFSLWFMNETCRST